MGFKAFSKEYTKMVSIPHFDQTNLDQFSTLISSELDDSDYEFSEKVDGSQLSFGVRIDKPYVKSKRGTPTVDSNELRKLKDISSVFEGMGDFLDFLNFNNLEKWIKSTIKENLEELKKESDQSKITSLVFFGEIFNSNQVNTIIYSKEIIGKGAVVVFGINVENGGISKDISTSNVGKKIMEELVHYLNELDDWKLYLKQECPISLDKDLIKKIETFISKNKDILTSRKRDTETLLKKAETKKKLTEMLKKLKRGVLKQGKKVKSLLGAKEIEGVVLRNKKTGAMAKFVDTDNFTKKNLKNWEERRILQTFKKDLYKELFLTLFKSADVLSIVDKQDQKLDEYLETKKTKYFKTLKEILGVIFDDVNGEVELEPFASCHTISKSVFDDYIKKIDAVINDLKIKQKDESTAIDEKHYFDNLHTLTSEITSIKKIMAKLDDQFAVDSNPYITLIEFLLGSKRIETLSKKYLE